MLLQALFYLLDRTHYWKKMFFILSRDWDKGTHDNTKNIFFSFLYQASNSPSFLYYYNTFSHIFIASFKFIKT